MRRPLSARRPLIATTALLPLVLALGFTPLSVDSSTAAEGSFLEASFEPDGRLLVTSSGTAVALSEEPTSDLTFRQHTGTAADGTQIVATSYYEPNWGPSPTAQLELSDDPSDIASFTEVPGDTTTEEYDEVTSFPSGYSASDLQPVVAEVSSPTQIVLVIPDGKSISDPGGGGGGTTPVEPPTTTVYRDGQPAGELTADGTFVDEHPIPGVTHTYDLELAEGDQAFSLTATGFAELTNATTSYNNQRIWFNYKTFLAPSRVSAPIGTACRPNWTIGKVYFGGDGRGYSSSSDKYRTRAQVKVDFPNRAITLGRWVSTTKRYKNSTSTEVVASATASKNGISVSRTSMGKSSASFQLNHSVGNPLCYAAGKVWYQVNGTVYKNGTASIYGSRLRAPNHEAYIVGSSGGSWKTVMRRDAQSLLCLNLNCGQDQWSAYFNKSIT